MSLIYRLTNQKKKDLFKLLYSRPIGENDLPVIEDFVAKNYTYDVPDRKIFGLTPEDIGNIDAELVRMKMKNCAPSSPVGFFVRKTGELVATFFHTIHDKALNDNRTDIYLRPRNEKVAAYLRFSNLVEGNIYNDLNTSKFMMASMACVKSNYRSSGILKLITPIQSQIARSMGCEYLLTQGVSSYVKTTALKAGYKILREVKYDEYVDPKTGKKPDLDLSSVHTSAVLLYMKISPVDDEFHQSKL